MLLSIIIICKNEEQHIQRTLESVLKSTADLAETEILLIDSFSTDRTIEIASAYNINILQLRADWFHSPAAGGHTGLSYAQGKYFFYMGGDMCVDEKWFKPAIDFLETHPRVGGVAGIENQIYQTPGQPDWRVENVFNTKREAKENVLGGAALYRTDEMQKAGGFNPFLCAAEEADLCIRIQKSGYDLYRLPIPMLDHYSIDKHSFQEVKRRSNLKFYVGQGQMLRTALDSHLFFGALQAIKLWVTMAFTIFLLFGALCGLVWVSFGTVAPVVIWAAFAFGGIFLFVLKKRSFRFAVFRIFEKFPTIYGLIKGFIRKLPQKDQYPKDVITIKRI